MSTPDDFGVKLEPTGDGSPFASSGNAEAGCITSVYEVEDLDQELLDYGLRRSAIHHPQAAEAIDGRRSRLGHSGEPFLWNIWSRASKFRIERDPLWAS